MPRRVLIRSSRDPYDLGVVDRLVKQFAPSIAIRRVALWHEEMLVPGDVRSSEIDRAIDRAEIAILLISSDFLADNWDELRRIEDRMNQGRLRVLPLVVRSCLLEETAWLQARAWQSGRPLPRELTEQEACLKDLVHDLLWRAPISESARQGDRAGLAPRAGESDLKRILREMANRCRPPDFRILHGQDSRDVAVWVRDRIREAGERASIGEDWPEPGKCEIVIAPDFASLEEIQPHLRQGTQPLLALCSAGLEERLLVEYLALLGSPRRLVRHLRFDPTTAHDQERLLLRAIGARALNEPPDFLLCYAGEDREQALELDQAIWEASRKRCLLHHVDFLMEQPESGSFDSAARAARAVVVLQSRHLPPALRANAIADAEAEGKRVFVAELNQPRRETMAAVAARVLSEGPLAPVVPAKTAGFGYRILERVLQWPQWKVGVAAGAVVLVLVAIGYSGFHGDGSSDARAKADRQDPARKSTPGQSAAGTHNNPPMPPLSAPAPITKDALEFRLAQREAFRGFEDASGRRVVQVPTASGAIPITQPMILSQTLARHDGRFEVKASFTGGVALLFRTERTMKSYYQAHLSKTGPREVSISVTVNQQGEPSKQVLSSKKGLQHDYYPALENIYVLNQDDATFGVWINREPVAKWTDTTLTAGGVGINGTAADGVHFYGATYGPKIAPGESVRGMPGGLPVPLALLLR